MSEEQMIKVWNRTHGIHGFRYSNPLIVVPVPPQGFQMIPLMEVYYANSMGRAFSKGILEIDPQHKELRQELGYEQRDPNTLSDIEMKELLTKFDKDAKETLEQLNQSHAFARLVEVAREMDLSRTKVRFVEDLTGMTVDDELLETVEVKSEEEKPATKGKKK